MQIFAENFEQRLGRIDERLSGLAVHDTGKMDGVGHRPTVILSWADRHGNATPEPQM
jgi:hypothetical protein